MYLFISILYRLILWAISPILFIFILIHSLFSPIQFIPYLCKAGILIQKVPKTRPIIWIHGVSAGEVASIQGIARLVRDQYNLLITTSTISGWIMAKKHFPSDTHSFFPIDYPIVCKRILKRIQPKAILFIEAEIWPNFLKEAARQAIPCYLLSGKLGDKEFKGYFRLKAFFREVFNTFQVLSMQSEKDCKRVHDLGVNPSKIFMGGNLKFDLEMDKAHINHQLLLWSKNSHILLAASTHPGEEKIVLKAYETLYQSFPVLKIIMAPRHPERSDSIVKMAQESGFDVIKWSDYRESESHEPVNNTNILILDTMGELISFYPMAHIVLLAGSFVKGIGGHNLVEPAYFAKSIIIGPYTHNYDWMIRDMLSSSAIIQLEDKDKSLLDELILTVEKLMRDQSHCLFLGDKAKDFVRTHQGASLRTFNKIKPYFSL
ncbi:MAG: 3-deoxy-D-manno-octulosonic acid transferase [bacterium]|nr:MAG: 3-deoxy-D-manno-octulosonic acid transferase [bacterium]